MAGVLCVASSGGDRSLSAAATETVLQIAAAANHIIVLKEVSISFKGIDNLAEPIVVELVKQTTAGTMTSVTPALVDDALDGYTIQSTAARTATVEPTTSSVFHEWAPHGQSGILYPVPHDFFRTLAGGRIGLRVTTPTGVNPDYRAYMHYEE